jgi:hypothetical protein
VAEGRPLSEVLPRMKQSVEDLCSDLKKMGLGKAEVTLYKTLARSGAITQDVLAEEMAKKKIQRQDTLSLCSRLIRLGLVHRDSAHRLLMVEHPMNVRASMSAGKLKLDSSAKLTTPPTFSGTNP